MDTERNLKRQHERFVCDALVGSVGLKGKFRRYGDDLREPDCIYEVEGESLGIEVATVYPRNIDAEQAWTEARGERQFSQTGHEFRRGGPIFNSAESVCARIQKEVNDKCRKRYTGVKRLWLCIQETSSTSDEESVKNWLHSITIPEEHIFEAIYLLHQAPTKEGGNWKAFKIWPK